MTIFGSFQVKLLLILRHSNLRILPIAKQEGAKCNPIEILVVQTHYCLQLDKFFVCVDIIIILMGLICTGVDCRLCIMSLACLICHSSDRSHSFRSYSISSSENDSRCSTIVSCLSRKVSVPPPETANSTTTSKVTPQPIMLNSQGISGAPRLVRSCAVRRDLVRDWNFDEVLVEG